MAPGATIGRARGAAREQGAILLVALVLCATLGVLSVAVLATQDAALRGRANAAAAQLAEAAAAAGVEWAAARDVEVGRVLGTTTLNLGSGRSAVVTIAGSSPHVTSKGRCGGAEVTLAANLGVVDGAPLPYAFASFDRTSTIDRDLTIVGSAYFADGTPLTGGRDVLMYGDLKLVTNGSLPGGMVQHFSGSTTKGVAAHALPVVDVSAFEAMSASASVRRYSGSTTLKDVDFTGIVVVRLGSGQTLTIEDSTIHGTVVVTAAAGLLGGGGLLGLGLSRPTVRLKGNVTIDGGTPTTGNLALLAAFCTLDGNTSGATVTGVTLAYECEHMQSITFTGQLVLMERIRDANSSWRVERPVGFTPDTPLGIHWPCQSTTLVTWLGRQ